MKRRQTERKYDGTLRVYLAGPSDQIRFRDAALRTKWSPVPCPGHGWTGELRGARTNPGGYVELFMTYGWVASGAVRDFAERLVASIAKQAGVSTLGVDPRDMVEHRRPRQRMPSERPAEVEVGRIPPPPV